MTNKELGTKCFNDRENWVHKKDISQYCKNYYKSGDTLIYEESDDDNSTEYYLVIDDCKRGFIFAYGQTYPHRFELYFEDE